MNPLEDLLLAATLAFVLAASHYLDVPDQPYPVIPAINLQHTP